MLTTNTPALRIFPATPGPHPIALLAHGNSGSKEMLFRFGEALAAAGFDCYSVDQAGYGESPLPCSLRGGWATNILLNFQELERALGAVDVFIGHSMGGGAGAWSVREAGFRPKLFIGVGAPVELGEHGPPVLLLAGLFEEIYRPAQLDARTNAQVVISPWCEHILEAYDPVLVRAAVKAACAAVGKPVPAAPTAWRWRFAGLVLGIAGALVLMFRLPELHPRLARTRRFIVPGVLLIAVILTMGTWIGVTPQLRRIPQQLVLLAVIWLALAGLGRLRLPRWSLAVVTGILALGCLALRLPIRRTFSFCHSHVHLGDQHAVVVAEHARRQNRHSWRVEAGWRHCHGHLCELCHRAIHATVLLKSEFKCPIDSPGAAIRLADGLAPAVQPACSRAPSLVQSQRLVRKGPFRSPSDGERNGPLTGLETAGHAGTKAGPRVFAGRVKPSLDYLDQIDINYRDHSQANRSQVAQMGRVDACRHLNWISARRLADMAL